MRTNQRSFAAGEITPEMFGRIDLTKYQTGLQLCKNFLVLPHGPITRRPGTTYINECFYSTSAVRLIPFAFNAAQTLVLEFGNLYVRFHVQGATLLEANQAIGSIAGNTVNLVGHGYSVNDWVYIGTRYYKVATAAANSFTVNTLAGAAGAPTGSTAARVYTLTSPFTTAMLLTLRFTQNADVMTIVSPSIAARELKRSGTTSWAFNTVSFTPTITTPGAPTVTATTASAGTPTTARYGVTAVALDGVTESEMSLTGSASNNLALAGNFNTITWGGVNDALRYNVYKLRGGIYGFIGQTTGAPATSTVITSVVQSGARFGTFLVLTSATVTTSTAHGFATNNIVNISGTGVVSMDGSFTVTVTSATTFKYSPTIFNNASSATGICGVATCTLIDDYILGDTSQTPPKSTLTLNSGADFPSAVAYHEQRRWFANTATEPQTVWCTRSATESNLTSSVPSREDDAIKFRLASTKQNAITHLLSMIDLIALTAGGVFRVYSENGVITPASVAIKSQSTIGSNNVQPILVDRSALYVQANGNRVRELSAGGPATNYQYQALDVTVMAPHLFNGYTIVDMDWADEPDKTVWCVRSDGVLLGMTYLPEQQVYAWHQHVTDGSVESVCCVSENGIAATYITVQRQIGARSVKMIERLHNRLFTQAVNAYFVDCGLTYSGSPATTISGLWHLEGETVSVLADGATVNPKVVTAGAITLTDAASTVHIGLAFTSQAMTLPLALDPGAAPASGQGMAKNVNRVFVRVNQSSLVQAGPSFTKLTTYPARAVAEPYGSPPDLRTGELTMSVTPSWNTDGTVCIQQSEPLPLTVLSLALDVTVGG